MKIDRLIGIITILLQKNQVTAPYLAEKFEVSRRTINRDLETLCQAGIPIITRQGMGGGISIDENYKIDKSVLTINEMNDIFAALKGLGSISGESQVEKTLNKLSINEDHIISLRESIIIDLASNHKGSLSKKITDIKLAIQENFIIKFDYYYEKGKIEKTIEPYFIIFQWYSWYLFGFCKSKNDWRLFKIPRLWNLEVLSKKFITREIPDEKKDLNNHFTDSTIIKAIFDKSVKYRLIEDYGFESFSENSDGNLVFINGFTNETYIISWLLSFGDKVKVIEPKNIICKMKLISNNLFNLYS